MHIEPWTVKASRLALDNPWVTVRVDTCELSNGHVIDDYHVIESADWVHIVALDGDGRLLINRQYRHGGAVVLHEIPGGIVDEGEEPLQTAQRELLEETGHASDTWELVSAPLVNPARQDNRVHCYLVRNVTRVQDPKPEAAEIIDTVFMSVEDVIGLIDSGAFDSAIHISSLLLALRKAGLVRVAR